MIEYFSDAGTFSKQRIEIINWPSNSYTPRVKFAIGWNDNALFLKYWVGEEVAMALTQNDNGPVWKDSCVEFFVSPDQNDFYYNFEFNCIGTCLLAYGNSRHNRELAPVDTLSKIKRLPSLEKKLFNETFMRKPWELFIEIPAAAFFKHKDMKFRKKTMTANFYKCGDGLSKPHYLTWQPIKSHEPDFHQPQFFGKLEFIT